MAHDTEKWCKFQGKTIFFFKNDKNLVNFDLRTRNFQNFYFYLFLLCKVFNVWRREDLSYMTLKSDKKFDHHDLTWGILQIFTRVLDSVKIGTLMGSFSPK